MDQQHIVKDSVASMLMEAFRIASRKTGLLLGGVVIFALISNLPPYLFPFVLSETADLIISFIYLLLIVGPIMVGYAALFLKPARNQSPLFSDVFCGFERLPKSIGGGLLYMLFIILWCLPYLGGVFCTSFYYAYTQYFYFDLYTTLLKIYLIPAPLLIFVIIAALKYTMMWYLMVDHPEMGPFAAMRTSKQLMRGNKGKLFLVLLLISLMAFVLFIGIVIVLAILAVAGADFFSNILSYVLGFILGCFLMLLCESALSAFYAKISAQQTPAEEMILNANAEPQSISSADFMLPNETEKERKNPLEF